MDLTDLEKKHEPSGDPFWQESWYFNFADAKNNLFGLARIGYRPSRRKADGLLLASLNGRPALLYPAVGRKLSSADVAINPPRDLRVGKLCFACRAPMDTWQLSLKTRRIDLDLNCAARTPPYFYPEVAVNAGQSAAASHYEQAGRVFGRIRFGGTDLTIDGWGQRDHSWGPRHWAGIGSWTWISAQFESGWAFNYWRLGSGSCARTCGFVGHANVNQDLVTGRIDWAGGPRGRNTVGGRLELVAADGWAREVSFTAVARWLLYKDGAVITETFGLFSCAGESGVGVVESLYVARFGWLSILPRVPGMLALGLYSR